jgi:hypothetical protein
MPHFIISNAKKPSLWPGFSVCSFDRFELRGNPARSVEPGSAQAAEKSIWTTNRHARECSQYSRAMQPGRQAARGYPQAPDFLRGA